MNKTTNHINNSSQQSINRWLIAMLILIAGIVVVGGLTRLTGSGLSMVDWRPIAGILPPITFDQWQTVFDAYKGTPEYKAINQGMSLGEFKFIFYWEYAHRIMGRIIGLAAIIPFLFFILKRRLSKRFIWQWLCVIFLIGCQGLLGWYMVQSGLVKNPHVSHFRLAAHLSLALVIFCIILWQLFNQYSLAISKKIAKTTRWGIVTLCITGIQIMYGAFNAGLHGGFYYNTFPKMGSEWVPTSVMMMDSFYQNILFNPIMLQWIHRWMAVICVGLCLICWIKGCRSSNQSFQFWSHALLVSIGVQFIFGVATILSVVWIPIAPLHQFGSLLLITSIIGYIYFSRLQNDTQHTV